MFSHDEVWRSAINGLDKEKEVTDIWCGEKPLGLNYKSGDKIDPELFEHLKAEGLLKKMEQNVADIKALPQFSGVNPLDLQQGGNHYKDLTIQPVEYIHKNGIAYLEGNVIKYVTRHGAKNGAEDIKKAIHYCQLILQLQYGETP